MNAPSARPEEAISLTDLEIGDEARVGEYGEATEYCERLIRMGLIPGTTIRLERRAPLGDPVEIRFRGYALVLRPAEAQCLRLERI
jgi:ferrous iron transport protein A